MSMFDQTGTQIDYRVVKAGTFSLVIGSKRYEVTDSAAAIKLFLDEFPSPEYKVEFLKITALFGDVELLCG